MDFRNTVKYILILLYFVLIITIERFYNKDLFNISLDIIPSFQSSSKSFYIFWSIITYFGTMLVIGAIYLILFFFIPLNKVITLTFLLFLTGYLDHTLKIVYIQERPLWVNEKIETGNKHACGYGNPSGHSLTSTCHYLSLWYILSEIINKKVINKKIANALIYILLIFFVLFFITVMISRLYFGVHSLNQIIFGSSIGLGVFLLFFPILKLHKIDENEYFTKIFLNRLKTLIFILIGIIFFYSFYFAQKDIPGVTELYNWKKMCHDQKWNKILIKASFMGGMSIFIILGIFLGLIIDRNKIQKEFNSNEGIILIKWDMSSFITQLIRLIIILLGFFPIGIVFLLNTFFNISYIFYYIITPILFFLGGFLAFGPCLFYGFKLVLNKFGNEKLYPLNRENNKSLSIVDSSNEIFN